MILFLNSLSLSFSLNFCCRSYLIIESRSSQKKTGCLVLCKIAVGCVVNAINLKLITIYEHGLSAPSRTYHSLPTCFDVRWWSCSWWSWLIYMHVSPKWGYQLITGLDLLRFLSLSLLPSFPAASSRTNVCTTHDNDDSPKLATNFHRQHTSGCPVDDNDDDDDDGLGGGCENE